uniref:Uncharacterized protein n=1 Tax=Acrobeloides nanus TaxID=290746 RepID=A0A914CHM3_9BILA
MPRLVLERLAPMIAYIEQEADEKVDEIQVRTDEEAKLEINKVVKQQRLEPGLLGYRPSAQPLCYRDLQLMLVNFW